MPQGVDRLRIAFRGKLHALKVDKLDIPAGATASLAGFMVNANSIAKASFTGVYGRPKK